MKSSVYAQQASENLWLLSLSLSNPEIGLSHLRFWGGFRLDQCFAVFGLGGRFVLISSDECMGGLNAVERFIRRLRIEYGMTFSVLPGCRPIISTRVDGNRRIWTHPAFRLMIDRLRNSNHSLETWAYTDHNTLKRFACMESAVVCRRRCTNRNLLERIQRELLVYRRRHDFLYGRKVAARSCVVVKDEPVYSPCIGCKRGRVGGNTTVPLPYQYVRRDNDEKWTLGWA
jgi:hypothetical protein